MTGKLPLPVRRWLSLTCLLLWSCGDPPPGSLTQDQAGDTSGGGGPATSSPDAVASTSDEPLLDEPMVSVPVSSTAVRPWLLEEEWRIGGTQASREAAFGALPVILTVDTAMNTYAIDGDSRQIRVFDLHGQWIRSFSGRGDGPGEFQDPGAAGWDSSGHLWVRDRNRYTVFDSLGGVEATVPRSTIEYPGHRRGQVIFRGDGRIVEDVAHPRNVFRFSTYSGGDVFAAVDAFTGNLDLGLLLFDPVELTIDTLPTVRAPDFDRRSGLQGPPPANAQPMLVARSNAMGLSGLESYVPRLVFAVTPAGVWSVASNGSVLTFRDHNGLIGREIELVREGTPLTAEEEQLIDGSLAVAERSRSDFAYARQWIRGVHLLEDGHVLVLNQEDPAVHAILDVYDPEGAWLGALSLDHPLDEASTIASRGSTLVVVARGALEAKVIISYRIVRGG